MAEEITKKLSSLAQLDIDAYHAYGEAIKEIDDSDIRRRLTEFQNQHKKHYDVLSSTLVSFGEKPPDFSLDFKGFFIKGFTAIRSKGGTESALKAMRTNEELTNRKYSEATTWNFSEDIMVNIRKFFDEEKHHLAYIEELLSVVHR